MRVSTDRGPWTCKPGQRRKNHFAHPAGEVPPRIGSGTHIPDPNLRELTPLHTQSPGAQKMKGAARPSGRRRQVLPSPPGASDSSRRRCGHGRPRRDRMTLRSYLLAGVPEPVKAEIGAASWMRILKSIYFTSITGPYTPNTASDAPGPRPHPVSTRPLPPRAPRLWRAIADVTAGFTPLSRPN
jgi:hypothetical protein